MKFFPYYLALALPLTGFSQDTATAIIVDDEEAFTSDFDDSVPEEEIAPAQDVEAIESNATTDEQDENLEPSSTISETLPEQPEDMGLPEPDEPVLVKIEIPKQIKLAESETGDFKLLTPWAPKPMQSAPRGWRYIPAHKEKAYPVEVKLATGKTLSLSVIPYTLVPEVSSKVVQAREPGYEPERGYQQVHSVSARLKTTTDNLQKAGDSLDQSIENLSALVDSLPK